MVEAVVAPSLEPPQATRAVVVMAMAARVSRDVVITVLCGGRARTVARAGVRVVRTGMRSVCMRLTGTGRIKRLRGVGIAVLGTLAIDGQRTALGAP